MIHIKQLIGKSFLYGDLCNTRNYYIKNKSQGTRRFLDAQHQELRAVLVELGLAK